MKKMFLSAATLLLCSWIILFLIGAGLPTPESISAYSPSGENGESFLAENRILYSRIYTTSDSSDKITDVYREKRRKNNISSEITELAASRTGVYFIREMRRDGAYSPHDWELFSLSGNAVTSLGGGHDTADIDITGLGVYHGEINVVGIDSADRAVLLALSENGGEWTKLVLSREGAVKAAVTEKGVIVAFEDGQISLYTQNSELSVSEYPISSSPKSFSIGLAARAKCMYEFITLTIILAAAITAVSAIITLSLKSRTVITGMTLTVAVCLLASFIIAGTGLCAAGIRQQLDTVLNLAVYQTKYRADSLSGADANIILSDGFYASEQHKLMKAALDKHTDTIFALKKEGAKAAISGEYLFGSSYDSVLTGKEKAIVDSAADGKASGFSITENGGRKSVSAAPITSNGVVIAVLFSKAPADIGYQAVTTTIKPIALTLLLIYFAALIISHLLLRFALRPISQLTRQMRAVSEGDLTANVAVGRNDEFGILHNAMQEMCAELSIRDYEVNSVIRSYRRFIPTHLHHLLDRASVMEVSFGDSNSLTGVVSLYSVNNRDLARSVLSDNEFVNFVSSCFSQIYEQVTAHNGELLSNGFDLDSIPVYYPDKPFDALNAGLGLVGKSDNGSMSPNFFRLLHHTTFMYGIAGVEDRVFPFFSSGEMEFLSGYSDKFYSLGVAMVATDAYMNIAEGMNGRSRYIGFVNSPDGKHSYKLYEILDAYSGSSRTGRVKYDRQFQDAIRLFYHSDFYLARNQFSSLLKLCPNDGIARWYLFACEQAFNSDPDSIDYQLFGIK